MRSYEACLGLRLTSKFMISRLRVWTLCGTYVVSKLRKALYSNLLLSTQVHQWVPALAEKVAGLLCGGLVTLSQQHYNLNSLAQSLVKRRWATLDALKSVPIQFTYFTKHTLVGRGDNLQLFISPLFKYEEWLYNIIDDKNFEINSLEPPVQGV